MRREDLADLSAFLAVAEARSFTRAAAQLGTSQSALSHTMRRLEERLGVRLLTRTTRSVAPTEAGERLMETLRPALDEIDGRLAALTSQPGAPAGTVRITTSQAAARPHPLAGSDAAAADAIRISRSNLPSTTACGDIVAERFDAGVRLGEQVAEGHDRRPHRPGP